MQALAEGGFADLAGRRFRAGLLGSETLAAPQSSLARQPAAPRPLVRAAVHAADPLTAAGLTRLLSISAGITVVPDGGPAVDVLVVSLQGHGGVPIPLLRRLAGDIDAPIVLITDEVCEWQVRAVVNCRVVAVLARTALTGERLAHCVTAAAGGGAHLPMSLVARLLKHIQHLDRQRQRTNDTHLVSRTGLTTREVNVLRLMADGLDTHEVAAELRYSESAVKKVVYGLNRRLGLRNRPHAVAYAIRSGLL